MPFPNYDISEFLTVVVDPEILHKDIAALNINSATFKGIINKTNVYTTQFDVDPDATDKVLIDNIITSHDPSLILAKKKKNAEIDARTGELIDDGFEFPPSSGNIFSLSIKAQIKIIGLHEIKDNPAVTYPVIWNNIDDTNIISLTNATDVNNFYLQAFGVVKAHLDSGTTLKDQIRVATIITTVDAIVDNR